MKGLAIIFMPFVLIYLAGVMVSLQWSPCDWSLWVKITAGAFTTAHLALLVLVAYFAKTIKTD